MKFISNLNETLVCPYQILIDVAEQITDCPPRFQHMAFMPICELETTNDWINLESLGIPAAIRAKAMVDVLVSLIQRTQFDVLSLDIYLSAQTLGSDNLFSLIYFAESVPSLRLTFYTPHQSPSDLEEQVAVLKNMGNVVLEFNHLSHSATTESLSGLSHLKNKRNQLIHSLGFTLKETDLQSNASNPAILNQLIGYCWMNLKAGAYDISCSLLEQAQKDPSLDLAAQEQIFMHLLMMRFFSHQYGLVTESDFPESFSTLNDSDIKTLVFFKAYAATLSRNLSTADLFFKRFGIDEHMPLSDENSLYRLNLFALFQVLQGRIDVAFDLEFRIKQHIEEHCIETVGLKYVNFINIARLYKKNKQFEQSLNYYQHAYREINEGGYSTSDHIYYNMNLGSLFEAAGNPELALHYWVKASLHWLACKNKYELSWRPRILLCQEHISEIINPLPIEKANIFLLNKLNDLFKKCHIDLTECPSFSYRFAEASLSQEKECCFIKDNIVVYTSKKQPPHDSKKQLVSEEQLAQKLSQYLNSLFDISTEYQLVFVDIQLDTNRINTAKEAMSYALLANCSSCSYNGEWLQLKSPDSLKSVRASLSRSICSITEMERGLCINYKRSFLNKTLNNQNEIDLVNQLKQQQTLDVEQLSQNEQKILPILAQKRILHLFYSK
ncbi:hypothetical protein ELY21_05900 [Legionella sp. km535]|uniref:tetratricopeptide repeat protein n=1 Tax=Legionella sp. km535 TaxID=2498107 RepID=UPI000F8F2377|nr:hypothetical protein [Legionella sp. km535]RUR19056.1 hypothetical protein ELY21_05900 [Legionella sp. km535]